MEEFENVLMLEVASDIMNEDSEDLSCIDSAMLNSGDDLDFDDTDDSIDVDDDE